MKYMIIGC